MTYLPSFLLSGKPGLVHDHLPNEIAGHLQSDPPEIVEGSFIDEALRSTQSDVLLGHCQVV